MIVKTIIMRVLAESAGAALQLSVAQGDDAQRLYLRRKRYGQQHFETHDDRKIPPYAGARQ
jgi:hypothetical protein